MREYFKDLPDETTPLSANRINGLLNGEESIEKIEESIKYLESLRDKTTGFTK